MSYMQAWYREGGAIILVIALVGAAGIAILVERLYVIVWRSKNNGRAFIERVIQLVRGGRVEEAIKVCAGSTAALPDIGLLILRSRSQDESDLQNVATAALLLVVPRLTRRLQYLRTFAVVAVLLGLVGTVLAARAALMAAQGESGHLLAGLGVALTPTLLGLVVAVVLTFGHGYLVSQAESITEEIREFSVRLINALIDRPDVRLGHR